MKHNLILIFAIGIILCGCESDKTGGGSGGTISPQVENLFDKPFIGTVDLLPSAKKPTGIVSIRDFNPDLESSYIRSFIFDAKDYLSGDNQFNLGDTVYFKVNKRNGLLMADSICKWRSDKALNYYKKDSNEIETMYMTNEIRDKVLANSGCLDLGRQFVHHLSEAENFHTRIHLAKLATNANPQTIQLDGVTYTAFKLYYGENTIDENVYYIPNNNYSDFKNITEPGIDYFMLYSTVNGRRVVIEISSTHNHPGN